MDLEQVARGVNKEVAPLNAEELEVLASLYEQLVLAHLIRTDLGAQQETRGLVVSLATFSQVGITPPTEFLNRVSKPGIQLHTEFQNADVPQCQLRFYRWVSRDTAYVGAEVLWGNVIPSGTGRGAMAVRESDRWRICPSRYVSTIN